MVHLKPTSPGPAPVPAPRRSPRRAPSPAQPPPPRPRVAQAFRTDPADKKQLLGLMFKIGVTHLQTVGIIKGLFPDVFANVFAVGGEASSIRLPAASLRCAAPALDTFGVFYGNMLLPALAPVFVACVMAYDRTLGCMHWARQVHMHPEQRQKARFRSFTKGLGGGGPGAGGRGGRSGRCWRWLRSPRPKK